MNEERICIDCLVANNQFSSLIAAGMERRENLIVEQVNIDTVTEEYLLNSLSDRDGVGLLQSLSQERQSQLNELALYHSKKWPNGKDLQVKFLDGTQFLRDKVQQFAVEWSRFANITFNFNQADDAEIRISFAQNGSWSYIGTDSLTIPQDEPTMNFGWFDRNTNDFEFSRTVIHEFGHALGCVHEHQSPAAGINWNTNYVYNYYQQYHNWTQQMVDQNIFVKYGATLISNSQYDPHSIMHYPIPEAFTTDEHTVGWNNILSHQDIVFIRQQYP